MSKPSGQMVVDMRNTSLLVAFLLFLGLQQAVTQPIRSGTLETERNKNQSPIGMNFGDGALRQLLLPPSWHRLQSDFRRGIDSLYLNGVFHHIPNDNVIRAGLQRTSVLRRATASPQSRFFVIDTAIVLMRSDTTRELYSFDAGGRMTSHLSQHQLNGEWVNWYCWSYTYDAAGRIVAGLEEQWSNGQWVRLWRRAYNYDGSGNLVSELQQMMADGQWVDVWRSSSTYDASGHILTQVVEELLNGQWVGIRRQSQTYDEYGRVLLALEEQCVDSQWEYRYRATFTYDRNWEILSWQNEVWKNGQLLNAFRRTITYDTNGRILFWLDEQWLNGQWVNDYRETRDWSSDANGSRLTLVDESWSDSGWVNWQRWTETEDANGRVISQLTEKWLTGQWLSESRYRYTYDVQGREKSKQSDWWVGGQPDLSQRWMYDYDDHGNTTSFSSEFRSDSSWTPDDDYFTVIDSARNTYSYFAHNVKLTYKLIEVVPVDIGQPGGYSLSQNYPNPFNSGTTIKYEVLQPSHVTLSVYDMLGREVSVLVNEGKDAGVHEVKFDGTGKSSGVYFYRLTGLRFAQTRKFVLLR